MQKKYSIIYALMLSVCCIPAVNAQTPAGAVQVNTASGTRGVVKPPAYGGSTPLNYVRTWAPLRPYTIESDVVSTSRTVNQVNQATQFIDGLGRSLQMVNWQASPGKTDIVAPVVYDAFGRDADKYLPYTSSGSDGQFKTDPFGDQSTFYGSTYIGDQPALRGEQYFYGRTVFETSPLGRPLKTFAPGNNWVGSEGASQEHTLQIQYTANTTSDQVRLWSIGYSSVITSNVPASTTFYDAGQLFKTITQDEQGKQVIEYKDKEGHVVLKKVQVDDSPSAAHTGWLCTYYVYDDMGQLRFVIPPKAVNAVIGNSWALAADVIDELCFRYEYDGRNRMIGKKVPDAAWVYMVYDQRDRLVFTQDGNMRTKGWWLTSLYDNLNRPVQTAMMTGYTGTVQQLQTSAGTGYGGNIVEVDLLITENQPGRTSYQASNSITIQGNFETETLSQPIIMEIVPATGNTVFPFTQTVNINPVPAGGTLVSLELMYYDNYSHTAKSYDISNKSKLVPLDPVNTYAETVPDNKSTLTQGLPTSSKVLVITDPVNLAGNSTWLETVDFYDDKGHTIQVQSTNYKGGNDVTSTLYDFGGKPLCIYTTHNNASGGITNLTTKTGIGYDHAGRQKEVHKTINDDPGTQRVISNMEYDALGQLKSKKIGQKSADNTDPLEDQQYAYNIRGWLKGINWNYDGSNPASPGTSISSNKWFSMDLSYDWGFTANQYNGNIAGMRWEAGGDQAERAYGYSYDNVNRLLKADFRQNFGSATSQTWANADPNNGSFNIDFSIKMGDGSNHASAYDENGNILKMQQMGLKLNTSSLIDNLTYKYTYNYTGTNTNNTNKLLAVNEDNNGTTDFGLGDFTDKNQSLDDYTYDANGNLTQDKNKNIQGITYNHLNLPYKITVQGKGDITYIYDAAGNKLEKITTEISPSKITKTAYVGGYVYENDVLQFLSHEEGRVRKNAVSNTFVYDYFLKDHLGNTRTVLTDEKEIAVYPVATLEPASISRDMTYYSFNSSDVENNPVSLTDTYQNNNGFTDPWNTHSAETSLVMYKISPLSSVSHAKTGLGITLHVMTGDLVDVFAKSFWHDNGVTLENTHTIIKDEILNALAGTVSIVNLHNGTTGSVLNALPVTPGEVTNLLSNVPVPSLKPKAYVNWILFDEQFRVVTSSSGFSSVGNSDVRTNHSTTVEVLKNGYLYVYCSNESNQAVFFDNLQLVHRKGPLLEETHYYPFGLTMAGISSKAAGKLENKIKFTGQELDNDLGWDTYQMRWRTMDPQIGRFLQVDPLAPKYVSNSTYAYAENRVINGVDLEGLEWENFMSKFKKPSELKVKPVPSGQNVQNQLYSTTVEGSKRSVGDLYNTFKEKPQDVLSNSKAEFKPVDGNGNKVENANLQVGSNIKVDIDGPMNNSYVRVTDEKKTDNGFSFTFSTLEGHIESGAITFSASQNKEGNITFSINSTSKVDQGAASIFKGFARSQQQQSWTEVLNNIDKYLQGKETSRKVVTTEQKP